MLGSSTTLLACLLVLAGIDPSPACSCAPPRAPLESLLGADWVFSGTVIEVEIITGDPPGLWDTLAATFQVGRVFKGQAGSEIVVHTAKDSAVCGYNFERGQSYLVYAGRGLGDKPSTSHCSRTRLLSQADEDIRALTPGPGAESRWIFSRDSLRNPQQHLTGVENQSVTIEESEDLLSWTTVQEIPAAASYVEVGEGDWGEYSSRFYRATTEPRPPEGVFGQVIAVPGVCLEDPLHPGTCLNLPSPGTGSHEVREHSNEPDLGFSNPIIATIQSVQPATEPVLLDVSFVGALNAQRIPAALWDDLAASGVKLSHATQVQVYRMDRMWILHDSLRTQSFVIQRQDWNDPEEDRLQFIESGWFRAALPPGKYCLWERTNCAAQIEIESGNWEAAVLEQFLP